MEYRNIEILEEIESVAKNICEEKRSNHHRDRFFPMLIDRLGLKTGVEIGVDKAGFSNHLLSKSSLEKFYGVDPWINDFGSDHKPGYYDPEGDNRMFQAETEIKTFIESGRAKLIRATGAVAATMFEDESIDFIYIDGDHSLEGIAADIYAWTPKIVTGGIISGHDYKDGPGSGITGYFGKQLPYAVKTVVDYFCERYGFKNHAVGGRILSWWFAKI